MPSATLINSVPTFSSPGTTPTSFNDIPPILRHREENVLVVFHPPLDGLEQEGTHGTLYVIDSALVFMSTSSHGFQIKYPAITLHAISRAESPPSIYCQLDDRAGDVENPSLQQDDESDVRELIIIPADDTSLGPIFQALSLCSSLHPDVVIDETNGIAELDIITSDGDYGESSEVGRVPSRSVINDRFAPY